MVGRTFEYIAGMVKIQVPDSILKAFSSATQPLAQQVKGFRSGMANADSILLGRRFHLVFMRSSFDHSGGPSVVSTNTLYPLWPDFVSELLTDTPTRRAI